MSGRPTVQRLLHVRTTLALHALRGLSTPDRRPLLLLHGLGERSPQQVPAYADAWPGPVYALDFTGHGASDVPRGGGYTAELLMGDADAALAHLGPCTIAGRGLGAYVAVLIAGARPTLVRGALLLDGNGLHGGGSRPGSAVPESPVHRNAYAPTPDPLALAELAGDVRPPDYAVSFLRLALAGSGLDVPLRVAAVSRAPWLSALVDEVGVELSSAEAALAAFADYP
jgi:pimeloyl-ACP methyl ester carboxylesterase